MLGLFSKEKAGPKNFQTCRKFSYVSLSQTEDMLATKVSKDPQNDSFSVSFVHLELGREGKEDVSEVGREQGAYQLSGQGLLKAKITFTEVMGLGASLPTVTCPVRGWWSDPPVRGKGDSSPSGRCGPKRVRRPGFQFHCRSRKGLGWRRTGQIRRGTEAPPGF